jgi:hypothetical protein
MPEIAAMDIQSLIFYVGGGCIILVVLVLASNFLVNSLIKQFTERALQLFQQRLSQEVAKSLEAFKQGVCEQMAMQEKKSDSLAKLYSALIDLLRDGKEFSASVSKRDPAQAGDRLLIFENTSRSFCDQYRKLSLHFSNEFKGVVDSFILEQEAVSQLLGTQWHSGRKDAEKRESNNELIRQSWAQAEDRIMAIMEILRSEFRKRIERAGR